MAGKVEMKGARDLGQREMNHRDMMQNGRIAPLLAGLVAWTVAGSALAATLQVGPGRAYAKPSQAAAAAHPGDTVEIDAGLYPGDVASWYAHNLTLRGIGGRAHLRADGKNAQGKGIWVIVGTNTTVENIEFSGATVPDRNGAGIRQEGSGLTVRNCYFHDNENGILTGAGAQSRILIEFSEFAYNGYGDGYSHNMYIGNVGTFTLRHCYSHHAKIGHLVKTRANANYILYNRLMDETTGTASYEINIPQGGLSYVVGNLIEKGPAAENHGRIIDYSSEGTKNATQALYVANNTLVNDYGGAPTFVWYDPSAPSPSGRVVNNVFVGSGTPVNGIGAVVFTNNLTLNGAQLVNRAGYDYHLIPSSSAVDTGIAPGVFSGFDLTPGYEYVHPTGREPRPVVGALDIGAYECSDRDDDAMGDNWEIHYFGSISNVIGAADHDADEDGMSNLREYIAGTDPTNRNSVLALTSVAVDGSNIALTWKGGTSAWQYVERRLGLASAGTQWETLFSNEPPTSMVSGIFDRETTNSPGFYRIRAVRSL